MSDSSERVIKRRFTKPSGKRIHNKALGAVPVGRPRKNRTKYLTQDVVDAICYALSIGANDAKAAAYAEINVLNLRNWRDKGEAEFNRRQEGLPPKEHFDDYVTFYLMYTQAKYDPIIGGLEAIDESIRAGDVKSAIWRTERLDPENFAPTRRVDLRTRAAKDGDIEPLSAERLDMLNIPGAQSDDEDDEFYGGSVEDDEDDEQ